MPVPSSAPSLEDLDAQWYLARAGRTQGPVSYDQLVAAARSGRLLPGDQVWREGFEGWQPVTTRGDLASVGALEPAVSPPQMSRALGASARPASSPTFEATPVAANHDDPEDVPGEETRRFISAAGVGEETQRRRAYSRAVVFALVGLGVIGLAAMVPTVAHRFDTPSAGVVDDGPADAERLSPAEANALAGKIEKTRGRSRRPKRRASGGKRPNSAEPTSIDIALPELGASGGIRGGRVGGELAEADVSDYAGSTAGPVARLDFREAHQEAARSVRRCRRTLGVAKTTARLELEVGPQGRVARTRAVAGGSTATCLARRARRWSMAPGMAGRTVAVRITPDGIVIFE